MLAPACEHTPAELMSPFADSKINNATLKSNPDFTQSLPYTGYASYARCCIDSCNQRELRSGLGWWGVISGSSAQQQLDYVTCPNTRR